MFATSNLAAILWKAEPRAGSELSDPRTEAMFVSRNCRQLSSNKRASALLAVFCLASPFWVVSSATAAEDKSESNVESDYKQRQDAAGLSPDLPNGPMTASELAAEALVNETKFARESAAWSKTRGENARAAAATSKLLAATHSSQAYTYWCGPAAVRSALLIEGVNVTQTPLSTQLKTTLQGTAWSGVNVSTSPITGRPVPDVMNNRTSINWTFTPASVASPASTSAIDKWLFLPAVGRLIGAS